jgi:hypothetical protein
MTGPRDLHRDADAVPGVPAGRRAPASSIVVDGLILAFEAGYCTAEQHGGGNGSHGGAQPPHDPANAGPGG